MNKILKQYEDEISTSLETLSEEGYDSNMYPKMIDNISKLTNVYNELISTQAAIDSKSIESEKIDLEREKLDADKKDRKIKNWLTGIGTGLTFGGAIWATIYNWKKEEGGTMTFTGGKKALDALFSGLKRK